MFKKLLLVLFIFSFHSVIFSENSMLIKIEKTSIEVPLGWLAQYTKSPTVFILYSPLETNDTIQENCNLVIESLPGIYTVDNYKDASIVQIEAAFTDFKLLESNGNYQIYTGFSGNTFVKQIQYVYIKNKTAYILTFTSNPENFDRYSALFESISNTFKY